MNWVAPVARVVFLAASLGGLASAYMAFASLLGRYAKLEDHPGVLLLLLGLFVVWFPTVLIFQKLTRGVVSRDTWKVALRHASPSMRRLVYGSWIYCGVVWAVSAIRGILTHNQSVGNEGIYFSAFMLVFYVTAVAVSASALAMAPSQLNPRCENGHEVGAEAKFCQTCGARVVGVEASGA